MKQIKQIGNYDIDFNEVYLVGEMFGESNHRRYRVHFKSGTEIVISERHQSYSACMHRDKFVSLWKHLTGNTQQLSRDMQLKNYIKEMIKQCGEIVNELSDEHWNDKFLVNTYALELLKSLPNVDTTETFKQFIEKENEKYTQLKSESNNYTYRYGLITPHTAKRTICSNILHEIDRIDLWHRN